jgi:hypothetical protein
MRPFLAPASLLFSLTVILTASSLADDPTAAQKSSPLPTVRPWVMGATDASINASIGSSVATDGSTVVAGSTGPVYVYEKPASGWPRNMLPAAKLTPSTGGFGGTTVAISGDTIVVGSVGNGIAYVFVRPAGGWTNMTETAQLSDGVQGDFFGISVAIDGNTIAVGASGTTVNGNTSQGAAYVFVKPPAGWATTSTYNAELTSSDGTYQDLFGISVGVSGHTVVAGAPFYEDRTGPGVVYVYVEPATGWADMTQTAELTESQQGLYDEFGIATAIYGNTIIVGAPQADSAYLFVKPQTGWVNMTETTQLLSSNTFGGFGRAVGIGGRQAVVGQWGDLKNLAQVYAKPPAGWQQTAKPLFLLYAGQEQAQFGSAVAIADDAAIVGAPDQTVSGNGDQGIVFGFQLTQP